MKQLVICGALLASACHAQTYNVLTIGPNPGASAVGKLRFAERSNSPTRKHLIFEGPDTLGADVRYKFDGGTTAGCLSLGALSGGVYPITAGSCTGQWITTGSDIYYSTGKVGIGLSSPAERLDVNGAILVSGTTTINAGKVAGLYLGYGSSASTIWSHDGGGGTTMTVGTLSNNGLTSTSTIYASSGIIINAASSSYLINSPTTALSGALSIGGITGSTQCLQANSSGDISGAGVVCGGYWTLSGSDVYRNSGNVGIGYSSPTERLDVNGAVLVEGTTTINAGKGAGLYLGYGSSASTVWSHDNGGGTTMTVGTLSLNGLVSDSYTIYASSGLTINGATSSFIINSPITALSGGLSIGGITGTTQCLQANSSGDVSGTGSPCGAGGGGSVLYDSGLVSGVSATSSVNLTVSGGIAPAGYYKVSGYINCVSGHTSSGSQADAYPLVSNYLGALFVYSVQNDSHLQCGSAGTGGNPFLALPPTLVYTDGSAHLTFGATAIGFASSQQYEYRVYLERF